jgi:hypothetical protein
MLRSLTSSDRAGETRDLARRAFRLANALHDPADRARLLRYAEDLEDEADRLEQPPGRRTPVVIAPTPRSETSRSE